MFQRGSLVVAAFAAVFAVLGVAVALAPARAGSFDQEFANRASAASAEEFVSGLVMIQEQVDLPLVEREMRNLGLHSRWRRHEFIVRRAQNLSKNSQRPIVRELEAWKRQGLVRDFQTFWVTNMIAVEAVPSVFDRLVARPDVGVVYANSEVTLREGWEEPPVRTEGDGEGEVEGLRVLPDNLICVNVQPAWDLGYDGTGTLVATFDSGADGNHPAFASRWRGAQPGVEWWEAWKDPYTNSQFPFDSGTHGTHVLGILTADPPVGNPIGVAPGALWISAGILIQWNVQKVIECYEWAIDPDGDPTTIDDVPDVINNSWGTSANCDQTFWNAIDLVEAAGIVNVISVDNSGPGYASVNSPESRALNPTVNFGVGNVDPHQPEYPIAYSSGRGPSPCDYTSIKPEVTAPGTVIYSTLPNNGYGNKSGTSMASPHVSGAVAILRQVNPDISVDEVKTALMATAFDRGVTGEDNDYGWGIIDIGAAVEYVRNSIPMYPPRNLSAAVATDSVSLSWQPPVAINPGNPLVAYRIYRAAEDDSFPLEPIAEVGPLDPTPDYRDTGLSNGAYRYVVTSRFQQGESGPSNEVEVTISLPKYPPRALTAVAHADTVSLAWERPDPIHPSNPPLAYRIYRETLGDTLPAAPVAEIPDSLPHVYDDAGLDYGGYRYLATALYENGESDSSNAVEVTIPFPKPPPRDLTAVAHTDTVSLGWERPDSIHEENPPLAYRLYRQAVGDTLPAGPIAEIPDSLPRAYDDLGLPYGGYRYTATALYENGESGPSDEVEVMVTALTKNPPLNLTAAAHSDTVSLAWDPPDSTQPPNPPLAYRLYRDIVGDTLLAEPIAEIPDSLPHAYEDIGLSNGVYRYSLTALYGNGESPPTSEVEATISLPKNPPLDLVASAVYDTVSLGWDRPDPIHALNPPLAYRIYRQSMGDSLPAAAIAEIPDSLPRAYEDIGMANGDYLYSATALYENGESDPSNEVEVTVFSPPKFPPRNLTAEAHTDTVRLAWDPPDSIHPENPPLAYRIYRQAIGDSLPAEPIAEIPDSLPHAFDDIGLAYGTYRYSATTRYANGESEPSNEAEVLLRDPAGAPDLALGAGPSLRVSPNPFNPAVLVRYRPGGPGNVRLAIYNPGGALVRTLQRGRSAAATEESVVWDGTDEDGRPVASGAYFVRLEHATGSLSKRVILLK